MTKESNQESETDIGFKYMYFVDIPKNVKDFKHKEITWYGFEKALEAIGLDSKPVLRRLIEGTKT